MPRMISLGSPQSRLQREPADLSLPEIYNSFWRAHGHVLSMDIKLVVGAYQLNTYQITMSGSPQSDMIIHISSVEYLSGPQLIFGSRKMKMAYAPNYSAKYTLALLVMFGLGLIIVVAVTGMATVRAETGLPHAERRVVPEVMWDCIPNYGNCMDIHGTKPCCRQQKLRVGQTVREDFICFRFGLGKCQPLSSVDKLETYAQLMKFANDTNLFRLLGQYYKHKIFLRKHQGKTE